MDKTYDLEYEVQKAQGIARLIMLVAEAAALTPNDLKSCHPALWLLGDIAYDNAERLSFLADQQTAHTSPNTDGLTHREGEPNDEGL